MFGMFELGMFLTARNCLTPGISPWIPARCHPLFNEKENIKIIRPRSRQRRIGVCLPSSRSPSPASPSPASPRSLPAAFPLSPERIPVPTKAVRARDHKGILDGIFGDRSGFVTEIELLDVGDVEFQHFQVYIRHTKSNSYRELMAGLKVLTSLLCID